MIGETDLAARLRARPWAEIIYLLTLTLTRDPYSAPATLTLRLSDRAYRYPEPPPDASATMLAPTEQWLPFVRSWGGIGDAIDPHNGGVSVAALDVVLDNSRPIAGVARFSDLIRTTRNPTGYDFAFSPAELRQVFKGTDELDRYRLFRLLIEELTNVSDETCTLKMSGIELVLEDYDILPRITTDRFPFAAPEAVGQAVPLLLGRIRNAPVLMAVAGLIDKLKEPITATFPATGQNLELSTPDIVARLPAAGVVQIKIDGGGSQARTTTVDAEAVISTPTGQASQGALAECISYKATDSVTARLLQITRGARSTPIGAAAAGTDVYHLPPEFVGIAGVNLGPLGAQELTAVYCDGMAKKPETQPVHTIEMANTIVWPPHSLTLVRFNTGETGLDVPWLRPVEMKEVAYYPDNCHQALEISGVGREFFFSKTGTMVMRLGLDAPCGSQQQHFYVMTRFNIADQPPNPGFITMQMYRGDNPAPGWAIGRVEAFWHQHDGPIGGGKGSIAKMWGIPPVGDYTGAGQPESSPWVLGIVLTPHIFGDQLFSFDITPAYVAAKAAGYTSLTIGLRIRNLVRISTGPFPTGDQIASSIEGQYWSPYTTGWYGIGTVAYTDDAATTLATLQPAKAPVLFLNAGVGGALGAMLTRPNAGTAARSAAEASLGFVTVDVTGPIETVQVPPPIGDGGTLNGLLDGFEEPSLAMWTVSTMSTSTDVRPGGVTGRRCAQTTATSGGYATRQDFSLSSLMRVRLYARIVSRTTPAGYTLPTSVLDLRGSGGDIGVHGMGFYHVDTGTRFYASVGNTTVLGTQPVIVGTWYRFEARFTGVFTDPATVELTVYDGDATTSLETITATATRLAGPSQLRMGSSAMGGGVTQYTLAFDDLVVTAIDEEVGPGGVWLGIPSSDVQHEMTPNSGTTNYSRVDDWPDAVDDASSYVTAMSPMLDRYRLTFPGGAPSASRRLRYSQMMLRATSLSGDPEVQVQPVVGTQTGTLYGGGITSIAQGYTWVPAGGYGAFFRWADVEAITVSNFTIGVQRTNVSAGTLRVTLVAINLDFH
jgi:hypothetical protein